MHEVLNPWANPVTYGVPFFLLAVVELLALKWLDRGDELTGYQGRDAATSLLMGMGSLVTISAVKAAGFVVYVVLYEHVAPWHLSMRTWWSWALAIGGVDLAYYWYHRFTHRVRVGWAAHQAHHFVSMAGGRRRVSVVAEHPAVRDTPNGKPGRQGDHHEQRTA